jgi:5'-deoxynucleotidase YfbR-like HD superfamily hydrolase
MSSAAISKIVDEDPGTLHSTSIVTLQCHVFDILNPSTWVFDIKDIATALSNICRFGGHLETHYSVAEHSLRVSSLLEADGHTPRIQMMGLLHDATEAYLGDIPSPIKKVLQVDGEPFAEFEHSMFYALATAFGINNGNLDEEYVWVKEADMAVYLTERDNRPYPAVLTPKSARQAFLERFDQLWWML